MMRITKEDLTIEPVFKDPIFLILPFGWNGPESADEFVEKLKKAGVWNDECKGGWTHVHFSNMECAERFIERINRYFAAETK
jgi:hypothetical protein